VKRKTWTPPLNCRYENGAKVWLHRSYPCIVHTKDMTWIRFGPGVTVDRIRFMSNILWSLQTSMAYGRLHIAFENWPTSLTVSVLVPHRERTQITQDEAREGRWLLVHASSDLSRLAYEVDGPTPYLTGDCDD